jgi:phospholipid/cholesterol/gamma-HCH transport system substrate-binding protein
MVNDSSFYVESDSLVRELRGLVADVKKNPKKYINLEIF